MMVHADSERRRSPRYATHHRIQGMSLDRVIDFQGALCDLSESGCRLQLDTRVPPGTPIEVRCDISGIALRISGRIVWANPTPDGILHGVLVTGFGSEEDALFQRLYLGRLARATSPPS